MGHIYTTVIVRGIRGEKALKDILVDTGATFTLMPLDTVEEVGAIKSPWSVQLLLADKRKLVVTVYLAEVEMNGRKGPVRIAAFEDAVSAIGVDTLETLGLKVNPITGELEAVRGAYILGILGFFQTLKWVSCKCANLR